MTYRNLSKPKDVSLLLMQTVKTIFVRAFMAILPMALLLATTGARGQNTVLTRIGSGA